MGYPEPTADNEAGEGRPWGGSTANVGFPKSTSEHWRPAAPPSVTGGLRLRVLRAMEMALTPGSQHGPEALCFSRRSLGTWRLPFHPRYLPPALAHVQNQCLRFDLTPELPSGTLSFPPSLSWESLHGLGTEVHGPGDPVRTPRDPMDKCLLSSFYDESRAGPQEEIGKSARAVSTR